MHEIRLEEMRPDQVAQYCWGSPGRKLTAVQQGGMALQYAADALKSDPEVVLAAVEQNGNALQYAHTSLRAHPRVVQAAVNNDPMAMRWASTTRGSALS